MEYTAVFLYFMDNSFACPECAQRRGHMKQEWGAICAIGPHMILVPDSGLMDIKNMGMNGAAGPLWQSSPMGCAHWICCLHPESAGHILESSYCTRS